jgi:putative ABC transport system substrate-binding protein
MQRREFIALLSGAAAAWPLASRAQQKTMPVIGYLGSGSAESEAPFREPFLKGLEQSGFLAGRNVAIEYRFAEGRFERLPTLAAELVRLPATVLVAAGLSAAVSAKKETATIPIVFSVGVDPVSLGLVESLNRPGGNATGVSVFTTELGPKRLGLLREMLPQASLVAVLFGARTASTSMQVREMEAAARTIGQPILVLHAESESETEKAFATMSEHRASGLVFGASLYFQTITDKLVALAARYRIPAIYEWPEFVTAGGLISYNARRTGAAAIAGDYVGRILKGASPADMPVQQATEFELVINLKTAKALGLTVPQSLLARIDNVIE